MMTIDTFCLSSYLAFRYVVKDGKEWVPGVGPVMPSVSDDDQVAVGTPDEILAVLRGIVELISDIDSTGIFLSGGIDSAILAALLPAGTRAYTINFAAESGANEADYAARYADAYSLNHTVVDVCWDDYEAFEGNLMTTKKAPLHAVEVALHKAALLAKDDGIRTILVGNGADSTFGGLDKLLSLDWTFDDFVKRYTFIDPVDVLVDPVSIRDVYEPYRQGKMIDYVAFLKKIHGLGIIQSFNNGVKTTGLGLCEPFEQMKLKGVLDINRIRAGEPKYLLFDVFAMLYPGLEAPQKVPFARPMDEWMADYDGPSAKVFRSDLDISTFTGDQKYLFHCLDKFLALLEEGAICR